jgi:hypothetical protein
VNKAVTKTTKLLLCILVLLVIVAAYYYWQNQLRQELVELKSKQVEVETQVQEETMKNLSLQLMRKELDALHEEGGVRDIPMADYDNADEVIREFHTILAQAKRYHLNFSPVMTEGDLARRSIGMNFGCDSYELARTVIYSLYSCRYRCQINEMDIALLQNEERSSEPVQVNLTVNFFETLF